MLKNKKELNKRVEKIVKAILNAAYTKVEIDDLTDENYIHITCDDTREVLLQKLTEERYYVRAIV